MEQTTRALRHPLASAFFAALVVALPSLLIIFGATELWASYGWTLFVAGPLLLGFTAAWLNSRHREVSIAKSIAVAMLALMLLALAAIAVALEGAICILMAAPLAVVGALLGALLAHAARRQRERWAAAVAAAWISLPGVAGIEPRLLPEPPAFKVQTVVEVAAPPEVVWRHVVSFPPLAPPREWYFRAGIAFPLAAEIDGAGVGAVRRCHFSTGAFVEPITVWDEPRRLAFRVTENPSPLEEWNPFAEVHPPHLSGFMVSERGEFRLEPLPGKGTRLIGETTYHHGLWPSEYWRWWSDALIHRIHRRVLQHVKELAEADV